jgi:predicted nucleic acid-binding protein
VVREVFASHDLCISDQVLNEFKGTLRVKFEVQQDLIDDFIELLKQDTIFTIPAQLPFVELQDKDDLPILGAAIAAGADVPVTGDKELLDLGHVEDLDILSPRQFWERLKARHQRRGKLRR